MSTLPLDLEIVNLRALKNEELTLNYINSSESIIKYLQFNFTNSVNLVPDPVTPYFDVL